ncbi:hypothetical protein GDO86_013189 [Hymenochirus boettgeri]|uniref:Peroxisomal leader peptide-processing protease n=1 Tax=Hymenochirus boettgeri TaxID=247094 RepID=A0A8T2IVQ6_9PIPI|nr:hypothetical protein GDO86_013189 [Hymenochirus boettgeri]
MLETAELSGCVITTAQTSQGLPLNKDPHTNTDPCSVDKNPISVHRGTSKRQCDSQWSCSGVILDRSLGLVLCNGAIFFPFLKDRHKEFSVSNHNFLLPDDFISDLSIQVEFLSFRGTNDKSKDHLNNEETVQSLGLGLIPISDQTGLHKKQTVNEAKLLLLVSCPEFQLLFSKLFNKAEGWMFFSEEEKQEYGELQKDLSHFHWFALLKLPGLLSTEQKKISFMSALKLQKGCEVFACGSPFGSFYPDIFLNTISKGVVSNITGDKNVVLLTDARCLPGSEGGGIFAADGNHLHLVGIIVAPLCWKANEWVGLTLACSANNILDNIMKHIYRTNILEKNNMTSINLLESCGTKKLNVSKTKDLIGAVVLVDSGQVWGSGILIDPKIVLTCRHVITSASRVLVKIRQPKMEKFQKLRGKVVFSTQETSPYDVAVIELEEPFPGIPQPVLAQEYYTGMDVLVWGYGAFGENCGPSVTCGVLSSVISVGDVPVMLQTTCAVHGGSSGGPIFTAQTGELLGIVASNTRDNATRATYPHLNFSIPISIFRRALQRFKLSGDLSSFQELNNVSRAVRNVWRLQRNPEKVLPSKL